MSRYSMFAVVTMLVMCLAMGDELIVYRNWGGLRQLNLANNQDRPVLTFDREGEYSVAVQYCAGYIWAATTVETWSPTNDVNDENRIYRFKLGKSWDGKLDIDPEIWTASNSITYLGLACFKNKYIVYNAEEDDGGPFEVVGCDGTEDFDVGRCKSPNLDVDDTPSFKEESYVIEADSEFVYVLLYVFDNSARQRRGEGITGYQLWKWNPVNDDFTRIGRPDSSFLPESPGFMWGSSLSSNWLWISGEAFASRIALNDASVEQLDGTTGIDGIDPYSFTIIAYSDSIVYTTDSDAQRVVKCVEDSPIWDCEILFDQAQDDWIYFIDVLWRSSSAHTVQAGSYLAVFALLKLIQA